MKQPFILPFSSHASATTCQIDSHKVLNSSYKSHAMQLCKIVTIKDVAPPQKPNKQGATFLGHRVK